MEYTEINKKTILNLSNLMSREGNTKFLIDFLSLNDHFTAASRIINKINEDDETILVLVNIFNIAIFFREHIELIHEMITAIKDN